MRLPRLIAASTLLTALAVVWTFTAARGVKAQSPPPWTPPYPLILDADRAFAMVRAAERHLTYLPGEVLVKFKPGVDAAGQQRALMAVRDRPSVDELQWIGDVALLRDKREMDATILAAQLSAEPEVEYAEPNFLYHTSKIPNDPGFSSLQWNLQALDMPTVWDINPGATEKVIVAVLDTGITEVNQTFGFLTSDGRAIQPVNVPFATNPDLAASRLTGPRDFAFWNGPVLDMEGHGTHVGATIGEDANNALAEAGIAYNVRIMPVKVCVGPWERQFILSASGFPGFSSDPGGCPLSAIAQGIAYAVDQGARVINLSLGGPGMAQTLRNALASAVGKGAFVAIAIGNEFEEGNPIEYPAAYAPEIDGVMSVGALGPSLNRAFYSNTGSHLEISAPGGSSREGGVNGEIWQSTIMESDFDFAAVLFPRFDRYAETPHQGTSMATPHVAGIAALLMSQGVTKPAAIEALIKATARDLGPPGRDNAYGHGLIQPRAALRGVGVK
jgi:serine protease